MEFLNCFTNFNRESWSPININATCAFSYKYPNVVLYKFKNFLEHIKYLPLEDKILQWEGKLAQCNRIFLLFLICQLSTRHVHATAEKNNPIRRNNRKIKVEIQMAWMRRKKRRNLLLRKQVFVQNFFHLKFYSYYTYTMNKILKIQNLYRVRRLFTNTYQTLVKDSIFPEFASPKHPESLITCST